MQEHVNNGGREKMRGLRATAGGRGGGPHTKPAAVQQSGQNCGDHVETMSSRDVSPEKGPGPSCGPKEEQWDIVKAEETEAGDPGLQGPLLPAGGPGSLTLHPTTHSLPDASRSPEAPRSPHHHPFLAQSRHARRPFGDALMSPC